MFCIVTIYNKHGFRRVFCKVNIIKCVVSSVFSIANTITFIVNSMLCDVNIVKCVFSPLALQSSANACKVHFGLF
jgi:hypothetical protein